MGPGPRPICMGWGPWGPCILICSDVYIFISNCLIKNFLESGSEAGLFLVLSVFLRELKLFLALFVMSKK